MGRPGAFLVSGIAAATLVLGTSTSSATGEGASSGNWAQFGGNADEQHYSPLDQITPRNVAQLGLVWSHDLDTFDSYTQPLEVDGTLYFAVGLSVVHALDARTGRLLWQYDPKVAEQPEAETRMRGGWGIRGIAYKDGTIFTGTREGRLIALDARTGRLRWSVKTLDEAENAYITGPPYIAGDKVVIGFGGADYSPVRAYVTAYDVKTGKRAWRWYVVPGDPAKGFENKAMEMAAKTWNGEWWKYGGGGTVFHAMAYDARFGRLYIGTGNGFPWNQKIRSPGGGDNLFLSSIVALDAKTGDYVWHYQVNPENNHDWNDAMDIEMGDVPVDGKMTPVLMHAPKNGFFYLLNRETGKLISAGAFGKQNWALGIDPVTGRPRINPAAQYPGGKPFMVYPFPNGAHGMQAMSFSPKSGLSYIPVMEGAWVFNDPTSVEAWKPKLGGFINTGLGPMAPGTATPPPPTSKLVAWDVAQNRIAWSIPQPGVLNGGTMATAGSLVFQGTNDGMFNAFAAEDGRKLWTFDAQDGILGAPISYRIGGTQYVTVITGYRGAFQTTPHWDYRQQQRRVLTFAIGGRQTLPAFRPVETAIEDDPAFTVDPDKARIGGAIYGASCGICHGPGVVSGGTAPDLRKSMIPLDADAFQAVVHEGQLMSRGMPKYANLTPAELEGLRHFIRARARASK